MERIATRNVCEVKDNGELLVLLNDEKHEKMVVYSKAFQDKKERAIEKVYVRETVRDLLMYVASTLPAGYQLVVWETYTPRTLHESLRKKTLSEEEMAEISHMTGGAVDVSLADMDGNLLEMGTELNHGSPENKTTAFFKRLEMNGVTLTEEQKAIRANRRVLIQAMREAGFTNNPAAWFHWDYGNRWWAEQKGQDAFYSWVDKE